MATLVATPLAEQGRPWRRALLWLALLGPFFFASYGFANWMAGRHATLPVMAFAWEVRIPFVPWTIVPYWSIDLFYAISFFLCRQRLELDRHALRLFSAQLIAVSCFLLWPLRFSFERPEIDGVFGWLFDVLLGFDKPFNQASSLHIVLLIVLWVKFAQYLHGAWRWVLHAWALLIGVSVLTTFQHHFIDIPTGLLAGWLCVWLWPEQGTPPLRAWRTADDARRWRLAALYLLGAAMLLVPVFLLRGVALWLLWPLVSLPLVALAYAGLFAFISGSSFVLTGVYGLSPVQYGFAFAFGVSGYIGGTILAQRLVGPRGMDGVIALGVLCLALGGLMMLGAVATGAGGAPGVALSWAVYACGVGLTMPQAQASAMMPFPDRAGAASSFNGLCQMLLSACVGLLVGHLLKSSALPLPLVMSALGIAAFLLFQLSGPVRAARERTGRS